MSITKKSLEPCVNLRKIAPRKKCQLTSSTSNHLKPSCSVTDFSPRGINCIVTSYACCLRVSVLNYFRFVLAKVISCTPLPQHLFEQDGTSPAPHPPMHTMTTELRSTSSVFKTPRMTTGVNGMPRLLSSHTTLDFGGRQLL